MNGKAAEVLDFDSPGSPGTAARHTSTHLETRFATKIPRNLRCIHCDCPLIKVTRDDDRGIALYRSPSTDRVVDRRCNRDPDGAGTETEDRSTRCAAHSGADAGGCTCNPIPRSLQVTARCVIMQRPISSAILRNRCLDFLIAAHRPGCLISLLGARGTWTCLPTPRVLGNRLCKLQSPRTLFRFLPGASSFGKVPNSLDQLLRPCWLRSAVNREAGGRNLRSGRLLPCGVGECGGLRNGVTTCDTKLHRRVTLCVGFH